MPPSMKASSATILQTWYSWALSTRVDAQAAYTGIAWLHPKWDCCPFSMCDLSLATSRVSGTCTGKDLICLLFQVGMHWLHNIVMKAWSIRATMTVTFYVPFPCSSTKEIMARNSLNLILVLRYFRSQIFDKLTKANLALLMRQTTSRSVLSLALLMLIFNPTVPAFYSRLRAILQEAMTPWKSKQI